MNILDSRPPMARRGVLAVLGLKGRLHHPADVRLQLRPRGRGQWQLRADAVELAERPRTRDRLGPAGGGTGGAAGAVGGDGDLAIGDGIEAVTYETVARQRHPAL
jgi:hypothetical protein